MPNGHEEYIRLSMPCATYPFHFSAWPERVEIGSFATTAHGVAIQANGKIVAAGDQAENHSFAVARYLGG